MRNLRQRAVPLLLLLAAGGALAAAAFAVTRNLEHEQILASFREDLAHQGHEIEKELVQRLETLRSLRALFDSSVEVTRDEFRRFAQDVVVGGSSIRALEWAPRVRPDERDAHEEAVRRSGVPDYRITRQTPDGSLVPAGRSDAAYFPIAFVEPLESNREALGFDLGSGDVRRAALLESAARGEIVLTPPIKLIQDGDRVASTLAFLGVRADAASSPSYLDSDLRGVVAMVLRYPDVIQQAFEARLASVDADMSFRLLDRDSPGTLTPYSNVDDDAWESLRSANGDPWTETIEIGGRALVVAAYPTAHFIAKHASFEPTLVALATLLLSNLVGGLFVLYMHSVQNAATRAHDTLLRSVLTSLSEGVVVADREAQILFANQVALQLLGPIAGTPPLDWPSVCGLHLDDAKTPCPVERIPLVRAIHGERVGFEHLYVRNEGNPDGVWLSVSGSPLLDDVHRLQGGIAVIRDITSRKRAEAQIRRLSAAVEQTADMVFITDRDGRIVYVNPAFERTTGWEAADALGRTPRILKSGRYDAEFYAVMWRTLLSGDSYQGAIVNQRRDGTVFHAEHTITPIKDQSDGAVYFVSVCRDISDRRQREAHEVEMALAATIQKRLYPRVSPRVDGFDVAGACFPASATCGDYFDFIPFGNGSLGLVVGDIAGHGLGPALLMAETRAYLRSLLLFDGEACAAIQKLDSWLAPDLTEESFVTLIAVVIDPARRLLTYVNAGHWPAVVLDAEGNTKLEMSRAGVALGLSPGCEYVCSDPFQLTTGDTIVLLTDGVLEARSTTGEIFGIDRALRVVRTHRHESAESIIRRLRRELDEFADGAPRDDDQTIVICRAVAAAEGTRPAPGIRRDLAAIVCDPQDAFPLDVVADGGHPKDGADRCADSNRSASP